MISIEADIARAEEALAGTSKSLKSLEKQITGTVARGSLKKIKSVIRKTIHGDGLISDKYQYSILENYVYHVEGKRATVYPQKIEQGRKNDLTIPVISSLSYGREIFPRKQKWLFINGKSYAKVKSIKIEPRNFVQAGDAYLQGNSYLPEIDKIIQKELKKYWGK